MGLGKISRQLLLAAATVSAKWIVPGGRWRDTEGDLVNAHAGGVTVDEESGKFFLFGEYKVEGRVEGGGISVYSSTDLVTWEPHGLALEPIEGHPYIDPSHIIQRPKVAYSEGTGKYHVRFSPTSRPTVSLIGHRCGGTRTTARMDGYYRASRKPTTSLGRIAS